MNTRIYQKMKHALIHVKTTLATLHGTPEKCCCNKTNLYYCDKCSVDGEIQYIENLLAEEEVSEKTLSKNT